MLNVISKSFSATCFYGKNGRKIRHRQADSLPGRVVSIATRRPYGKLELELSHLTIFSPPKSPFMVFKPLKVHCFMVCKPEKHGDGQKFVPCPVQHY